MAVSPGTPEGPPNWLIDSPSGLTGALNNKTPNPKPQKISPLSPRNFRPAEFSTNNPKRQQRANIAPPAAEFFGGAIIGSSIGSSIGQPINQEQSRVAAAAR